MKQDESLSGLEPKRDLFLGAALRRAAATPQVVAHMTFLLISRRCLCSGEMARWIVGVVDGLPRHVQELEAVGWNVCLLWRGARALIR